MVKQVVMDSWFPKANMKGIIVHWTAGHHNPTDNDKSHYHFLIKGNGEWVKGFPHVSKNSLPKAKLGYAAHTLGCNTGYIGVSLCCMAGATESPFNSGPSPMTKEQWEALPPLLAFLCRKYSISVSRETILSHAEVSDTLGKPQRGKWDITRLSFDPSVKGAHQCGDIFRAATKTILEEH